MSFIYKNSDIINKEVMKLKNIKFIDLFAGMGGLRLGFELACNEKQLNPICVMTSEIKPAAIKILNQNFSHLNFKNDIRKIESIDIPDFDILLGGFPCQAFSTAGKQQGFADTRGTLFFEIERILKDKQPMGFILENVEGLLSHDKENKNDTIGRTFKVIINNLERLGYKVSYKILNSETFGVPQARKRVFIVGTLNEKINLENFETIYSKFFEIQENKQVEQTEFVNKIFQHYSQEELYGKSFKDKRGGKNNIHSWDIELKGCISNEQKELLELLLKERRYKKWSKEIGIDWMDGIPLTLSQIQTFYDKNNLLELLEDLVSKGYLVFEHPKSLQKIIENGVIVTKRIPDTTKEKGYNIVAGKLSFPFTTFVDPNKILPTLTATDVEKIGVVNENNIRKLTIRECLRAFGYPEEYSVDCFNLNKNKDLRELYDLLGNTVVVPVVKNVSCRLLEALS